MTESPGDPTLDEARAAVTAGLADVRGRLAAAAQRAGRDPAAVTLVAVSKRQPLERVQAAVALGVRDLGENYAQSLRDRAVAFAGAEGLRWHAIGPLQRNKARIVAEHAACFHALDRHEVAVALGRHRTELGLAPLACYVEVNLAGESTKAGVDPADTGAFVASLAGVDGVEVVGLMAMPPPHDDPEQMRPWFVRLRTLAADLGLAGLSMGTTDDFEVAVEEGATAVRVGRAIFGPRTPPLPQPVL